MIQLCVEMPYITVLSSIVPSCLKVDQQVEVQLKAIRQTKLSLLGQPQRHRHTNTHTDTQRERKDRSYLGRNELGVINLELLGAHRPNSTSHTLTQEINLVLVSLH